MTSQSNPGAGGQGPSGKSDPISTPLRLVVSGEEPALDERTLRRALAETRVAEAKRLVEQAQNILDRAARNLSPIIGGIAKHRKVSALSDRCRGIWDELDTFERSGRYELDGAAECLMDRGEVER